MKKIKQKGNAAKSISLIWIFTLFGAGCSFACQLMLARSLGPSEYGNFSTAFTVVTTIAPLAAFGIQGFWLKAFGEEGWYAVRWLRSSVNFAILSAALSVAAVLLYSFHNRENGSLATSLAWLSAYIWFAASVEIISAKYILEDKSFKLAIWQLIPQLTRLIGVAIVFFTNYEHSAASYSLVYSATCALVLLSTIPVIKSLFNGNLDLAGHEKKESYSSTKESHPSLILLVRNIWPFGTANFLHLLYFQGSIFVIHALLGSREVGIYYSAFAILTAVYLFPTVVYQKYLFPRIHRWANTDIAKFKNSFRLGNRYMLAAGFFTSVIIIVAAPIMIKIFYGQKYLESAKILQFLALGVTFRFLAASCGSVLITKKNMQLRVKIIAIVAVFGIALNIVLIHAFGINGAIAASILVEISLCGLYYFFSRRLIKMNSEK